MIKIVNIEGPTPDPVTFQPFMRITADFLLEVTDPDRTEQENAHIFYSHWKKALETWNAKTLANPSQE